VSHVAIVTDSASDMSPYEADKLGIRVVPLIVNFGSESFKAGVELSKAEFWARMTAPDAPFPTTAASAPGDFLAVYQAAFDEGAESIVSIHVADKLSGTIKSAQVARERLPDREIHVVDSHGVSMAEGILAEMAVDMARLGVSAAEIVRVLGSRAGDISLFVALDTLEYLKKGGRISGARAAIGSLLSVKPIITIVDDTVETADRVRTKGKARERLIELVTARPIERVSVLCHEISPEIEAFRDELVARIPGGIDASKVSLDVVGASVGPHLGPGFVGAVSLHAPA
jgi:DegV family protein with EDD domain